MNFSSQGHYLISFSVLFFSVVINFNLTDSTKFFDKRTSFNASYQVTPPFIRLISSGYWVGAVDALWIGCVELIGGGQYTNETRLQAREIYSNALALDPDFYELYDEAGVLFSFFHESAVDAIEFLKAGIHHFETANPPVAFWTHPASLYVYLAYTYAFQLNDWTRARETFIRASTVKKSPPYLQHMREWLLKEGSEAILAKKVLHQLIDNTDDKTIRAKYEEKLKQYER